MRLALLQLVAPFGSKAMRLRESDVAVLGGSGRALLNFGMGARDTQLVITGQTGIVAASVVMARRMIAPTVDHSSDEHLVEDLEVDAGAIVPGVGFTIFGWTRGAGRLYGVFNVAWQWS